MHFSIPFQRPVVIIGASQYCQVRIFRLLNPDAFGVECPLIYKLIRDICTVLVVLKDGKLVELVVLFVKLNLETSVKVWNIFLECAALVKAVGLGGRT